MIGSPICTLAPATSPVVASIVSLENVAPRRPSRPVRPPRTTTTIAGLWPVGGGDVVGEADAAAVDERVGDVTGVVEDGAGDRRQADLVAVVGNAGDYTGAISRGCSTPSGSCRREVEGPEAQDVGDCDRAGERRRSRRG